MSNDRAIGPGRGDDIHCSIGAPVVGVGRGRSSCPDFSSSYEPYIATVYNSDSEFNLEKLMPKGEE